MGYQPKYLYPNYKGTRGATQEPLKQQFITIENMLQNMGFSVFFDDIYEADDIIGSIVQKIEIESGDDTPAIYVITKDHDYLQLIDDCTRLWLIQKDQETADKLIEKYYNLSELGLTKEVLNLPAKTFEFTPDTCFAEFGVWPWQIPDLKGIQGDSSDNIPGIKGVSSAAIPLLKEYSTLEGIIDAVNMEDERLLKGFWKNDLGILRSPIKAIKEYQNIGLLSKDLATIRRDYPLPELSSLEFIFDKNRCREELFKYEIKSIL